MPVKPDPVLVRLPSAVWQALPLGVGVGVGTSVVTVTLSVFLGSGAAWVFLSLLAVLLGVALLTHRLASEVFQPHTLPVRNRRWWGRMLVLVLPAAWLPAIAIALYAAGASFLATVMLVSAVAWLLLCTVAVPLVVVREGTIPDVLTAALVTLGRKPVPPVGAASGAAVIVGLVWSGQPTLLGLVPLVVAALFAAAGWESARAAGIRLPELAPEPWSGRRWLRRGAVGRGRSRV